VRRLLSTAHLDATLEISHELGEALALDELLERGPVLVVFSDAVLERVDLTVSNQTKPNQTKPKASLYRRHNAT